MSVTCTVCPRHCELERGKRGQCRARANHKDEIIAENYGRITSLALDPIEKKPFARFHPGHRILSVGSYGCNMRCSFCLNHTIAQKGHGGAEWSDMSPKELLDQAEEMKRHKNVGIAFTYNEPAVGWEWVRDVSKRAVERGMVCAMVTNGYFSPEILEELLPTIAAFNIDLKCFTEDGYKKLGGDLATVQGTIERAVKDAHVEVTTLIVPGLSDSEEDMEREAAWLASVDPDITLHISRYFPYYNMEAPATDIEVLKKLEKIAKKHLKHVYLANI